jgi:hypothetical protein
MDSQLSETPPSDSKTTPQVEDEVWLDDDNNNIPINSFYQRSDSEDSIGDTFFPGYRELEDIPTSESERQIPPWCPGEDFSAVEELKLLFPSAFGEEQEELDGWKKRWCTMVGMQRIGLVGLLSILLMIFYVGPSAATKGQKIPRGPV